MFSTTLYNSVSYKFNIGNSAGLICDTPLNAWFGSKNYISSDFFVKHIRKWCEVIFYDFFEM